MARITNLEGTTWKIKANPDVSEAFEYDILFNTNGVEFDLFKVYFTAVGTEEFFDNLGYGNAGVPAYVIEEGETSGNWNKNAYHYIQITGGADVEDADLIEWLYANAELIHFKDFYNISVDFKERVLQTGFILKRHDLGLNCFYVTIPEIEDLHSFCDEIKVAYRCDAQFFTKEYVCPLYYTDDTDLVSNKIICDVPDEVMDYRGHWTAEIHLYKGESRKATAKFGFIVQPDISKPKCHKTVINDITI